MTRILMFGYGALPVERLRLTGPALRTWHFLRVLLDAGHDVCLIGDRTHGIYPDDLPDVVSQSKDNWTYHSVSDTQWHNPAALQRLVEAYRADCAVGVTTSATAIASQVIGDLPLWGDLYGSIMAEAQLKALVYGDDSHLRHFWEIERKAIARADVFSSVSERQGWSLIGELGMWGRLNQWTSGYNFVSTIPIASETAPYPITRKVIRGVLADPDAFVILYSGGYNTWTDVDTLFKALESVMSQCPEVVFISTGGRIEGHDDITYKRFQRLIEASPYRTRYKLCGWVPTDDIPGYYLESNVAVNVDRPSYEAMLGSRTRVLDWMRAELPCVLTPLTELSQQVAECGAGMVYKPGDADDLARCLMHCIADPAGCVEMGKRGRQLLLERFTYEITARPLLEWVKNPGHAPDYQQGVPQLVRSAQSMGLASLVQHGGIDLALALKVWPLIARITALPGLRSVQHFLARYGMKLLHLERPPYQAHYLSYDILGQMSVGQRYSARLKIANRGTTVWPIGVKLSYHWLNEQGHMIVRDGLSVALVKPVKKGQTIELTLPIVAPEKPGRYRLDLDMLREGVTWFSEVGSPGPSIVVDIV